MTETLQNAVKAELAYRDLPGGFEARLTGVSGAFAAAVPVALLGVAVLTAAFASAWVAAALVVLAVVLVPRTGGRLHGVRVQTGTLALLGPDRSIPLHRIARVDLTVSGLTLRLDEGEPIELQLAQSLGARAWLAERIREIIVEHGDFEDVPAALARLRGEEQPDA
ncbi:MAG: hypothetical protein H6737_18635 [Alphaproteobacteria bacterium]|nr:hypothetical protein [Alphaproteobacteria bacterium]